MSRQKKTNRKTSSATSSSSIPSSMCSSENGYWQTTEQPIRTMSQLPSSSHARSIYPNVPKRTRPLLSMDDSEIIDTESRIDIIPSGRHSSRTERSSDDKRRALDLLMKYTSPTKEQSDYRPLSPIQSEMNIVSNRRTTSQSKRALSPLNEIEQESRDSKRPKSFDDDDDEEDIFELIDHRRHRSKSSQISNTSISSQSNEPKKGTVRKPTARKLSTSQQKSSASQPIIIDLEITTWPTNDVLPLNEHPVSPQTNSTPIILSPVEISTEQSTAFRPIRVRTPVRQTFEHPMDNSSPCSNQNAAGRRFSSTSSASLLFDTPNSSFSRTTITTMNNTSTPQPVMKNNIETQISMPSPTDMIKQLIREMHFFVDNDKSQIDYNPNELSKQFFQQSSLFFTNDKHRSAQFLPKKQFVNFGRYEIEIPFPNNENQNCTVHICDRCLKYFPASSIAYQRHTGKCFSTQPPGKAIFLKDNLAIFQINGMNSTVTQRLYLKCLFRMTRLFLDPIQTIDDSNIDRFVYYILCRQDPILSPTQLIIYRFVGYFSQPRYEHIPKLLNNLSRLFLLPPFINQYGYEQLLISLSYSLIRLNYSMMNISSSPARPLDNRTLIACRTYWLDVLSKYLLDHHCSSSFSLENFTRETFIHPRDILFSLYSSGLLIRHAGEHSSVYLDKNAYHSMTCLNRQDRNKYLHLEQDLIDINDEKKMMIDKANSNRMSSTNLQEIILD